MALGAAAERLSVRVVDSNSEATVLEYELGSFSREPVEIDGETFYTIDLAGESPIMEKGSPELPNICRSIVIPDDAEMAVRVVSSHYVEFPGIPVAPSKGILTRDIDPATVAYSFG